MNRFLVVSSTSLFLACGGATANTTARTTSPTEEGTSQTRPLPIVSALSADPDNACGPFADIAANGADAPSGTVMDALAGRLRITLPSDAVSSARPVDIMAAPTGDDRETRFLVDRGDSRLVVFVSETFATSPGDLATAAAALEAERIDEGNVVRMRFASGLEAALVEPTSVGGPQGGVLIDNAWLITPEGTIVFAGVYVTPDIATTPSVCRSVARRILTSFAPGAARLDLSAGQRQLGANMSIDVPARHIVRHDAGPDFDVFHVRPLVPFGAREAALGIYVGGHPSFEPTGVETRGTLLGTEASFFTETGSTTIRRDAFAPISDSGLAMHVFIEAPTVADADALTHIAESIRVRP